MAYDLHITRKNDWGDEDPKITQEEWVKLLENHPELKPVESVKDDDIEIFLKDSKIVKWTPNNRKNVWFVFSKGNITVSGPDEQTIQKMKKIALVLHAKVQGDDGEFY